MIARVTDQAVLWRRLDTPGHDSARLYARDDQWRLRGTAVFAHEGQPCRLDYVVVCDLAWQTLSGRVGGWVGTRTVEIELAVDLARRWRLNKADRPDVSGCLDLDLGFSPSTNLLPIRRLNLAIGQEARVRAAWLGFPSLTLEPLEQRYRRLDSRTYRYESAGGRFVPDLEVNAAGFVTRYPDFWQLVEASPSAADSP